MGVLDHEESAKESKTEKAIHAPVILTNYQANGTSTENSGKDARNERPNKELYISHYNLFRIERVIKIKKV